ncbi:unnamed protein product [Scytosiphon promiscuus]
MTKPGFVFGAPSSGSGSSGTLGGIAAEVPATSAPSIAAGGFSFLNTAATAPAPPHPQPQVKLPPQTSRGPLDSSATSLSTQSITRAGGTGLAFGEGRTALQGGRLNKRFSSWISRCLAGDTAAFLDSGLRDYAAFAAEIRERADLDKIETSTSTAFRHPSGAAAAASVSQASPKFSKASIPSAPPASAAATTPPPEAAPTPPPPVAQTGPAFSFSAGSTIHEAPSGKHFSFAVPSASAFTSTSAAPSVPLTQSLVVPPVVPPSGGFQFNAAGLGTASVPPGVFKGFQLPTGVAIPPPVASGSSAAGPEEDGMPKEDPSKLERAPGEENEEIVGQFRAKLFRFKKDEKAWGDMGVGMLRLMKHTTNDGRRLVLRNDMGKLPIAGNRRFECDRKAFFSLQPWFPRFAVVATPREPHHSPPTPNWLAKQQTQPLHLKKQQPHPQHY